ncbi:hypothetical protein BM536_003845 [Streptomyces phaeoluteigriseus]|uniref:CR-type domain-containing protein n=1 Tax=Streptomyces phaeoluteigriseus TaxID=114686 RepID=A0A1V6MXJ7_9ACTN|nr:hypothetical protein BM536_003845 [Streptomyces phaeoluteigriseus]
MGIAVAADDPSDDEVRAALDAFLARAGNRRPGPSPTDFILTRLHLLEGSVTRRVEHRTEEIRHRPGTVALSERPVYDVLGDYKLSPHETPLAQPLDLVRRGSVHLRSCDCGNGRRRCADCDGMKYRPCEPAHVCAVCQGITACTHYLNHGGLPGTPPRPPRPGRADRPGERVTCEACHTPESACPGCRGWGKVRCPDCEASGRIPCTPCGRTGTVECATCEGHGNLTSWTAGRIAWTSQTKAVPSPVPRPRRVASELCSGGWHEDRLGDDPLPDDLSPTHRAALEPHLRRWKGEKERQLAIQRLTVVKATPPGSGNLEFYVFRGTDGRLSVVRRLSEEGRWKASLAVAAAVALVVLVLVLVL